MFLSMIRIIKFSLQDITRNIWLSIVTITILALALLSVNMLLTVQAVSQGAVKAIKEKANISLYIKADASEENILSLKKQISSMALVKSVQYTSKQDALNYFRDHNKNNPQVLNALKELGWNPLSPSLIISPGDVDKSEDLINDIKKIDSDIIESRDFSNNSALLSKINSITSKINDAAMVLIAIFVLTSMLVAYNSIKVAIYIHRREIEIMRLVGSPNSFIYMPFMISAVIYALCATMLIIALFYPFLSLLQPYLEVFFTGYNINIVSYFVENFWPVFGVQFLGVAAISILSSWLAIRRYARV
ncbi:MAG: permease-like cell division protein FtsX [Candidatus Falkowbacteria bacterium]